MNSLIDYSLNIFHFVGLLLVFDKKLINTNYWCEAINVCSYLLLLDDGVSYVLNNFYQLFALKMNGSARAVTTVPIGSSNKINCFFMPEFLTEKKL